jgi:hypothetical protein
VLTIAFASVLVGVASPAQAADVNVGVGPKSFELKPGESAEFQVDAQNSGTQDRQYTLKVQAPGELGADVTITGTTAPCTSSGAAVTCVVQIKANDTKSFKYTLSAKNPSTVPAGGTKQGSGSITIDGFGAGGGHGSDNFDVKLRGPDQAPAVGEISGIVKDSKTGQPVNAAIVMVVDSARRNHQTGTDNAGRFKFPATENIAPGELNIGAGKDGFKTVPLKAIGNAGQALTNVALKLTPEVVSPSAQPATSDTAVAEAPSAVAAAPTVGATQAATTPASSNNSFSLVLIVLGGLLVLLGIGAIVLLLRRRDDDDPDDDPANAPPPTRGPGSTPMPVPANTGVYHGGADPTMVARSGGMNDATAIVRPIRPAEDPYAAPIGRGGQYGGQSGAVGYPDGSYSAAPTVPQQPAYGTPAGYVAPVAAPTQAYGGDSYHGANGNGYAPANGYGTNGYGGSHHNDQPEYGRGDSYGSGSGNGSGSGGSAGYSPADDATGHYEPRSSYSAGGGYGGSGMGSGSGSGSGSGANGYDPQDYARGGRYDTGPGYDAGSGGNGYPSAGSYPSAGNYDAPGYDPGNGYDAKGYRGGYDPAQYGATGHYDDPGTPPAPNPGGSTGRASARPVQPPMGSPDDRGRQQLGWLDD